MDHSMMHHDHDSMMDMDMTDDHAMMMMDNSNDDDQQHLLCSPDSGMGMIMYMEGFRWTLKGGGSCLNFFAESWKLDTVGKFVVAMLCTLALGILTEGISRWKHAIFLQQKANRSSNTNNNSNHRRLRLLQTISQVLSIVSAYLLMLVVMSYSIELLLCVVGGLMIGYYVFDNDEIHHGGGSICCNFLAECEDNDDDDDMTEALLSPRTSLDTNEVFAASPRAIRSDSNPSESFDYSCCSSNNNISNTNGAEGQQTTTNGEEVI